jgi:hypothetical protein
MALHRVQPVGVGQPRERQRNEVDEGPHTGRQLVPLRVDGVDVGIRRGVLRQHLHQPAVLQVALDVPLGAHQDAVAVQRPVDGDLAVVGGQVAAGLDGFGGRRLAAAAGSRHTP